MPAADFVAAPIGARLRGQFVVSAMARRVTREGEPYVTLTLRNAKGALATAPLWTARLGLVAGLEDGRVVMASGYLEEYRGMRRLRIVSLADVPDSRIDWPSLGRVAR